MNENQTYSEKEMNNQLLLEIINQQKKTNKRVTVLTILAAVIVAILLVTSILIVPKAVTALNESSVLIENVDSLVNTNNSSISGVLEKVNGIDFDSLNSSIKDLSDIISPLADFFGAFKSN